MQDHARGQTVWLVVVFVFVFLLTVALTVLAARLGLIMMTASESRTYQPQFASPTGSLFSFGIDWIAIGLSSAVILIGALVKKIQLSEGGQVIAHMMGGRRIDHDTPNLKEKRLLNVVEEMSIASGIPVPPVYVLHNESTINAFAAGLNPANAVLGFSKGAIEKLNRDELQGVVAHEFSHIFNGDMRLNMRLITLIAGLQSIAHVGRFFLDTDSHSSRSSRDRDSKLALFGFVIMIIGLFGAFMAGLVKSAVSRQREYLADATAMQYTRNPNGIGGALLKIMSDGFSLNNFFAKEASHFLFASEANHFSFSTHPPLRDRVQRISPELLKQFESGNFRISIEPLEEEASPKKNDSTASLFATASFAATDLTPKDASHAENSHLEIARIETALDGTIAIAAILSIENLRIAKNKDQGISSEVGVRLAQAFKRYSAENGFQQFSASVYRQIEDYMNLDINEALLRRTTVLRFAIPQVRKLDKAQRAQFFLLADSIVKANEHVSIFEGACLAVLRKALAIPNKAANLSLADSSSHLLSAIANMTSDTVDSIKAFQAGRTYLASQRAPGVELSQIRYIRAADQSGELLAHAFQSADQQSLKVKRALISSIETAAMFDRKVSPGEAELLRMVGLALDMPNPRLES